MSREVFTYPSIDDKRNGSYELAFNDTHGMDRVAWQLCVKARGYVTVVSRQFEVREGSQTMDIEMLPGPVGLRRRASGRTERRSPTPRYSSRRPPIRCPSKTAAWRKTVIHR